MDTGGGAGGGAGGTGGEGAAPGGAAPAASADDDEGDGAIVIGADGQARDKLSGKYVPHAALHKERERRKATDAELTTLRERLARGDERLAVLTELMQGGADQAKGASGAAAKGGADVDPFDEEPIDPEDDVFGALRQAQRQNAALVKQMKEGAAAAKANQERASVASDYRSDALAFARETPDFGDAYNHLIAGMHRELEAMGVTDESARNRSIAEREKAFASEVMASKKSPAAALYAVAKARGYVKAAPGAPAAASSAAVAKLEAINRGKEVAVSLATSGGTAGGDGLTLEALSNMSEAEFAAVTRRLGKSGMARIMGG